MISNEFWYLKFTLIFFNLDFGSACLPSITDLPPPVVHTECLNRKTACQMGYFCGPYGCTKRRKTLGTKTVKSELNPSVSFSPSPTTSITQIFDERFERCCTANLLPDGCFQFCSFSSYNVTSVSRIFSGNEGCQISALPVIHFCASQNLDHRRCCSHNFVPTDCLLFCAPSDRVTKLDHTKLHCLQYLSIYKDCFHSRIINHKYLNEN